MLKLWLTTVNGPAPTGALANASSAPAFWMAVGEAIQVAIESNSWLMNAAFGTFWCTTTVYGPVAAYALLTGVEVGFFGLVLATFQRSEMPAFWASGPKSRSQLNTTAWALNGVPSLNFTPCRSVIVTSLASGLNE